MSSNQSHTSLLAMESAKTNRHTASWVASWVTKWYSSDLSTQRGRQIRAIWMDLSLNRGSHAVTRDSTWIHPPAKTSTWITVRESEIILEIWRPSLPIPKSWTTLKQSTSNFAHLRLQHRDVKSPWARIQVRKHPKYIHNWLDATDPHHQIPLKK